MASSGDRIRRVLADGAVPTQRDPPPGPPRWHPRERGAGGEIRARLAHLGVGGARGSEPQPGPWSRTESLRDDRPLAVQVGGLVRETTKGAFLLVEKALPLDREHGRAFLSEACLRPIPVRPHERGPTALESLAVERAVFLDTETTGLSGGTGTVAFLVGTGRVEGDRFVVRQYAMRDYPDEPAMLDALAEDLGDAPLVTFNGRSFDWPLLTTRWHLHRMSPRPRAHIDLLPTARRLWARTLPSRSLGALERWVLGLHRTDDLPGWRIPGAWFDYLRTGRAEEVALAFHHNETDIVSMLALWGAVTRVLLDPSSVRHAQSDPLGAARFLLEIGDMAGARRRLEAAVQDAAGPEQRGLRRHLGRLLKRLGEHLAALDHWSGVAHGAPEFDAEAYREVARLLERRLSDPATALRWTEEALERCPPGTPVHVEFERRAARLRRRVAS